MSDRAAVFAKVRRALAGREKSALPEHDAGVTDTSVASDLVGHFVARLERVRGRAFDDVRALAAWLSEQGARRGYADPTLLPLLRPAFDSFVLDDALDRERIDDAEFGITRAAGGIAETGTLIITDGGTSRRLGALAPWVHVAVLERSRLHRTVHDAVLALGDDPNVIWVTGPSKTADVEGILIEGVHGPGEQVVLLV